MKKVALVAVCDFVSLPNGGEVFLLNNMLSANESTELEYYLVGMTFDPAVEEGKWQELTINGIKYQYLPVTKVLKDKERTYIPFRFRVVAGLYKYMRILKSKGFENYYIHSAELGIPFWGMKNISLIYHVHGNPSQTLRFSRFSAFRTNFWSELYLSFIRKTITKSKTIIWAAQRCQEDYLEVQPSMRDIVDSKSVVVHSSFDTKLMVNKSKLPALPARQHLVTVARLARIKHIDFIIEAISVLIKDGLDIDLLICGDGEERTNLQNYAKELGIANRVLFLGLADRETLATILDISEVFLFASESEAMSLVVLESLYMGTPVVSTNVGDLKEAVHNGKSGFIVEGYDLKQYVNCIKEILDASKQAYSAECKMIARMFTPEKMAMNISKVLKNENESF